MINKIVVTIAMQRSGTKFFGSCLNEGLAYQAYGEVLHPQGRDRNTHLSTFLQSEGINISFARFTEIYDALDKYFEFLIRESGDRFPHIDIMYNNLGSFCSVWTYPSSIDSILFLDYIKSRRIGVVHIVRESFLDAYISDCVANTRGVYHAFDNEIANQEVEIKIDTEKLKTFIFKNYESRKRVRNELKNYSKYLEIYYPDFGEDNKIVLDGTDYAKAFSIEKELFGKSGLRKTTNRSTVRISNTEEVEDFYSTYISTLTS